MSRFTGKQYKGASRDAREVRKIQAEERNARTALHFRRQYREGTPERRLLMDIFGGAA